MEENCTVLLVGPKEDTPPLAELKDLLESKDVDQKVKAMKSVITAMLNGESMGGVMMHIIRFCCTSDHHQLKKLLMLYWESVEKRGADGKPLPEMILVCNALRNDLTSANEYVRGSTLRLCTKLREKEILEPLIPTVIDNLHHREAYVRRSAVLAIFAIYKAFPNLIPNGPEIIEEYISPEIDLTAKRNAFLMLFHCDQPRAVRFLSTVISSVHLMGDGFQLVVLELIRKLCRSNPQDKSAYIKCVITLMETATDTVLFECANTLVAVSNAPIAIRACASCYTQLLASQSDNNVKLVVLERLADLRHRHKQVLQEIVIEILNRGIQSPNKDIQGRSLGLAMEVVTDATVDEVVSVLKKEITRISSSSVEHIVEHRQGVVKALHSCATKFPSTAGTIFNALIDLVSEDCEKTALVVLSFAREVAEVFPTLRPTVVARLADVLGDVKSATVISGVLWVLGQYSETEEEIATVMSAVEDSVGPLPIYQDEPEDQEDSKPQEQKQKKAGPTVLADGTYQTQSAIEVLPGSNAHTVRNHIEKGEYFLCASLASTLAKLVLRCHALGSDSFFSNPVTQQHSNTAMCVIVSILRYATADKTEKKIDIISRERIEVCLRAIATPTSQAHRALVERSRDAFTLSINTNKDNSKSEKDTEDLTCQPDDVIKFRQLGNRSGVMTQLDIEDEESSDVQKATGEGIGEEDFASRMSRITALTGFSDPLYAEALVTIHQFDIILELTIVNRTKDTMQNVLLELSTVGDLKLCDRPTAVTLAPHGSQTIKTNIKVASTETGVVFGTVSYDTSGSPTTERNIVVLNDLSVDIMNYIHSAECSEEEFRRMWQAFEWENRVAVNTQLTDVREYLDSVIETTNMKILTPPPALEGDCDMLSANLYARSSFNEDALVNVSVEKVDGKILGYIRIRSKTQGIALGLGDRVTVKQKA